MLRSEITQRITAHFWNVVHGHKGFVAAWMPTAVTNCLKPKFTPVTLSAAIAIITRPQGRTRHLQTAYLFYLFCCCYNNAVQYHSHCITCTCRYTWRPLVCYAFINIKLALCHLLLYVVYMWQKLMKPNRMYFQSKFSINKFRPIVTNSRWNRKPVTVVSWVTADIPRSSFCISSWIIIIFNIIIINTAHMGNASLCCA